MITWPVWSSLPHFAKFLHCTVTLFLLFLYSTVWKEVTMQSPQLQVGSCAYLIKWGLWHKLFGILLAIFVSSPCFVLAISHSFISYGLKDIYFILWGIIQYYIIYSDAQIVLVWATGSSFRCLCPFDIRHHFVLGTPYFLVLQDNPSSSCIFPSPALEYTISLRSSGSFHWRRY